MPVAHFQKFGLCWPLRRLCSFDSGNFDLSPGLFGHLRNFQTNAKAEQKAKIIRAFHPRAVRNCHRVFDLLSFRYRPEKPDDSGGGRYQAIQRCAGLRCQTWLLGAVPRMPRQHNSGIHCIVGPGSLRHLPTSFFPAAMIENLTVPFFFSVAGYIIKPHYKKLFFFRLVLVYFDESQKSQKVLLQKKRLP